MQRAHQLLFVASLGGLSWLTMQATHELGHVVGACLTGGSVERVILHPLSISRTDVNPNPHPGVVVWLGPVLGCLIPLTARALLPSGWTVLRRTAGFIAGFCLIANGAYIAVGSFELVGDCGEMLRSGTPRWTMLVFGAVTIPLGLDLWHRLGSPGHFIHNPAAITRHMAYATFGIFLAILVLELALSPR